ASESPLRQQPGPLSLHDALPISNERSVLAPQLPPGHRLETVPRSDLLGDFDSLLKNDRLAHAVLLPLPACSGNSHHGIATAVARSEEHTSELQSLRHLVCRLLLE